MAHSALIVEQYVYHFLSQWHAGLQPSLSLDVQLNGSIAVSLNLTTPKNAISRDYHRSGQGARRRRRVRRRTADPKVETFRENAYFTTTTHDAAMEVASTNPSTEFIPPQDDSSETCTTELNDDEENVAIKQCPINCIRQENGCQNIVKSYYNKYTAICNSCILVMEEKLKLTPFPHNLCPCCHQPSGSVPLSLCSECLEDIHQDGWTESGHGAWHLDPTNGRIRCIYLNFDQLNCCLGKLPAVYD